MENETKITANLATVLAPPPTIEIDEVHTCQLCETEYKEDESCYARDFGAVTVNTSNWFTEDQLICDTCLERDYTETNLGWVRDCDVFLCDHCGEHYHLDQRAITDYYGNVVCDDCASDYVYCEDIEDYVQSDLAYYNEFSDCWYKDEPNDEIIRAYNANVLHCLGYRYYVQDSVFSHPHNALVMGVELEVDRRRNVCAEELAEVLQESTFGNFGICKSDSTVTGFEMCLLPADLYAHRNVFKWHEWCDILRPSAKGHYAAEAGMHVHINASALSDLTMGKMLVFMNHNENVEFINLVAQRDCEHNTYCTIGKSDFADTQSVGNAGKRKETGKFTPLNYTGKTLECRIFRSSLLPNRILKNLEFCAALVHWCKFESVRNLRAEVFERWISKNRKDYPELHKFITERSDA